MNVSQSVGKWYDLNKRSLPWRETKNPYYIWISEILLQQTRMKQGIFYYHKFIKRFPTIFELAASPVEEVLNIWQGLGYYSRARNMHKAANTIVDRFHGDFPSDLHTLRQLPGIGDYSAAAIASLAFHVAVASIDGNVYRLLARYYGITSRRDTAKGKKDFKEAASELLDRSNPGRHNQAMIELGALICLPKKPLCDECPLNASCYALKNKSISELPKKKKKSKQVHRYFYYLVIIRRGYVYMKQRTENDIWALLYDFPLIETQKKRNPELLVKDSEWVNFFKNYKVRITSISPEHKHVLSHQIIHARFIEVDIDKNYHPENIVAIGFDEIDNYPFPRLIDKYVSAKIIGEQ